MPRAPQAFKNHPMRFGEARNAGGFRGICQYVVDGDTMDCLIDVGFHRYPYQAIRVSNVDTPEIFRPRSTEEYVLGIKAKDFVHDLLFEKPVFLVVTGNSFNRYVAEVWYWKNPDAGTADVLLANTLRVQHLTKADVPTMGEG